MASAPNMTDLQPVFEIQLSSEIEDDESGENFGDHFPSFLWL